jgi:gluconokinase
MNILVLEASTSAAKAMVYDNLKGILHTKVLQYPDHAGTGELQDATVISELVFEAGRSAAKGCEISAISIVSVWHSLLLCKNRVPVSPVYTWMFTESDQTVCKLRQEGFDAQKYHATTGCMPHATYPFFKLLYLRGKGVDIADCEIAGLGDFISQRLTGKLALSRNMASGTGLLNLKTLDWDEALLDQCGLDRSNFPELHNRASFPLLPSMADRLGVSAGIPVTLAFSDGFMNQIGAGAYRQGVMTMSVGTSCAVRVMRSSPLQGPESVGLWNYYGIDSYIAGAATAGGTNCVNWFQKNFTEGRSLKDLDQQVVSGDLPVFLPFLFGERCPGWDAGRRGGFAGLTGGHRQPEMYSAVLEGILFNIYQCYKLLATSNVIAKINLSGGILYSRVWRQMAADLFQTALHTPADEQASLLGGAAMALLACDPGFDLTDFGTREGDTIHPQKQMARYYQDRYQLYLKEYRQISTTGPSQNI